MNRLINFFLPKEERFFELFSLQSRILVKASDEFLELVKNYSSLPEQQREQSIRRLRKLEQKGDRQSAEIIELLNKTLIAPYDREDIHALTVTLDDMLDLLDETARKLLLYKTARIPVPMRKQAEVLHELVKKTDQTIHHLHRLDLVKKHCEDLYSLEHRGDEIFENAISGLFNGSETDQADILNVIKFKDLYECLESVFDKGKDLSDTVSAIVVKHG